MKKVLILSSVLMLSAYNANAAGLYIGAGYGNSDPDFTINTLTIASDDQEYIDNGWYEISGWPEVDLGDGSQHYAKPNADGYWASPWGADLPEKWVFDTEKTKTFSFSVGWAIPRNPFRFEFEYLKSSFKSTGMMMYVYPKDGAWVNEQGTTIPTDVYEFDLGLGPSEALNVDATSYMANVLFEIPGFGNVDPYIGYGYGVTKLDAEVFGSKSGSDNETTTQLIAGVEYRVSDTPLILGLEYKKLKMDQAKEKSAPDDGSFDYKHDMIMFKVKYDFISDKY